LQRKEQRKEVVILAITGRYLCRHNCLEAFRGEEE